MLGIQSMIAEGESEKLSQRVLDGKQSGALKGNPAGRVAYGLQARVRPGHRGHRGRRAGPARRRPGRPAAVVVSIFHRLLAPARRTTRPGRGTHLLSSLARCGVCGGKLVRRIGSNGRERYECQGYACTGIDKQALDDYVSERIVAWLSDPAVAAQIAGGADSAAAQQARADKARAEADLER